MNQTVPWGQTQKSLGYTESLLWSVLTNFLNSDVLISPKAKALLREKQTASKTIKRIWALGVRHDTKTKKCLLREQESKSSRVKDQKEKFDRFRLHMQAAHKQLHTLFAKLGELGTLTHTKSQSAPHPPLPPFFFSKWARIQ